jgi:hypothetical protein
MDRAVFGVAAAIARYRAGDATLANLVDRVDQWIGSMVEVADRALLEAWRREANRLEFANASMLDEGRTGVTPEEVVMVDAALDAFDGLCRPWTALDGFERDVLDMLVAGDAPSTKALQSQLAACRVVERERTGVGFFTKLGVDRSQVVPLDARSARLGDVLAEIEGLQRGAGFLLWITEGYIDLLEGYSYDESWPVEINSFSLSHVEEPRDLSVLGLPEDSAPAVHHDPRDVVAGNQEERGERPHEG